MRSMTIRCLECGQPLRLVIVQVFRRWEQELTAADKNNAIEPLYKCAYCDEVYFPEEVENVADKVASLDDARAAISVIRRIA